MEYERWVCLVQRGTGLRAQCRRALTEKTGGCRQSIGRLIGKGPSIGERASGPLQKMSDIPSAYPTRP